MLLLPQRYVFSSKSQPLNADTAFRYCCCCYHKGTYFQANHNALTQEQATARLLLLPQRYVFSSKSQHIQPTSILPFSCCCYHKGTYFQANHNRVEWWDNEDLLLLLPQRYVFSSKSQHVPWLMRNSICCCCYHKGTYFQANHNYEQKLLDAQYVVVATTKVRIFKQITTYDCNLS